MAIDLAVLRIIKYRKEYDKVFNYIPLAYMDKRTKAIIKDYGKFFELDESATVIDFPAFRSLFFTSWHKNLKDEDCKFYNELLTKVETDVSATIRCSIIKNLVELELASDVANVTAQYDAGDDISPLAELEILLEAAKDKVELSSGAEYIEFDEDVIDEEGDDNGLRWPLDSMNNVYRNIRGGDQYIIAARPGQGKTSFISFLLWSISQQLAENKIIVWFNNESKKSRIMSRVIQSALGLTNNEVVELKKSGGLSEAYNAAMGTKHRVRVYDIHGKSNVFLEGILESIGIDNVGAIVVDMLDNVRYPTSKEVREDQRLEKLYQWLRETGVKYDCPTFPTSQISNEGSGILFPASNMLKDSKTGKQGACDGILMLGHSDDPALENTRGLVMPKTKSLREGQSGIREEILFDKDRGRFKDAT